MGYKYQMHTHTSPCSKCAVMTPQELAEGLYEGGYSGCVMTNHFYGGNTGIDREIPWESFVDAYEKDWRECVRAAEKYGLDILFGVEDSVGGGREILCYGFTPELLRAHPELAEHNLDNWIKVKAECDGLIIQAHPFRVRAYITNPGAFPLDKIDGIEVYNAGNLPEANTEAEDFAIKNSGIILTAGADTHNKSTVCCGGLEFDVRIRNNKDLIDNLRKKLYRIIKGEEND